MLFMSLHVCTERDNRVFGSEDVLACHDISGGKTAGDTIIGRDGVNPKNRVLYEMDKGDAGQAAEWQRAVSTSGAVFDCAEMPFDVGDMFIGCGGVQVGVPWPENLEFVIGKDGVDNEATGLVQIED
jgi:hypothetical protein